MLFCDTFSIQTQDVKVETGTKLAISLWPISNTPLKSSLRSLSFDKLSNTNDLKSISVLAVFCLMKGPEQKNIVNESVRIPIKEFKSAFQPDGFLEPINLTNNRGFCFFLNGTESDCISRGRCMSFQQVINTRMIGGEKFIKVSNALDLFPILSQFSLRFPTNPPPLTATTFIPFKQEKAKLKIFPPKTVDSNLKWEKNDKLLRWKSHLSPVIENKLYVSGDTIAQDKNLLLETGITHIVNCASHMVNSASGFIQLDLPMSDGGNESILSWIFKSTIFIKNALSENTSNKVLVHCIEGVSRSVTICIAYLILTRKYDYEKSFKIIRSKRRVASPHPKFMAQLIQLSELVGSRKNKTSPFSLSKQIRFYLTTKPKTNSEANECYKLMKPKYTEREGSDSHCFVNLDFSNVKDFEGLYKRDPIHNNGIVTIEADDKASEEDIDFINQFADDLEKCLRVIVNRTYTAYKYPEWKEDPTFSATSYDSQSLYILVDKVGIKIFIGENFPKNIKNFDRFVMQFCSIKNMAMPAKYDTIYAQDDEYDDHFEEEEDENEDA